MGAFTNTNRRFKRAMRGPWPMILLLIAYEAAVILLMLGRFGAFLGEPAQLADRLESIDVLLWVFLLFLPVIAPSIQSLSLNLPGGTKVELKKLVARMDREKQRVDQLTHDGERTVHSLTSLLFTPRAIPEKDDEHRLISRRTAAVGCQGFTEQRLMCAIVAEFLRRNADFNSVVADYDHGGAARNFVGLARGAIDIYPVYTWTGFEILYPSLLGEGETRERWAKMSAVEMVEELNRLFSKSRYPLEWLCHQGFRNDWQMVMRTNTATNRKISKLSDLGDWNEQLVLGCEAEFRVRANGYGLLRDTPPSGYGLRFKDVRTYDRMDVYSALRDEEVDIIDGFVTDPQGANPAFTTLEDDRALFGAYHAAIVARKSFLDACEDNGIGIRELLRSDAIRIDENDDKQMNDLRDMIRTANRATDPDLHLSVVKDQASKFLDRRATR